MTLVICNTKKSGSTHSPRPPPPSDCRVVGVKAYLVLVDKVGQGEEKSARGHDEGADHSVHEADHQYQEEGRVHLRGGRHYESIAILKAGKGMF